MDMSTEPMPTQPTVSPKAPQSTTWRGAALDDAPLATTALPVEAVVANGEGGVSGETRLQRFKENEAARRALLVGKPAAQAAPVDGATPWRHTARELQQLKTRARATQIPFRMLRAWSAALHLRGLTGLEPSDWEVLPPAEALAAVHQRLQWLGALAEAETITREDITMQAATLGWRPQRLQRWLQRYRTGGLLALLGPCARHAAPVATPGSVQEPHLNHDRVHDRDADHPRPAQRRPRDLGALDEHALEEALQRRMLLGDLVEQLHASRAAVAACAQAHGVGERTIWGYLKQYRAFGLAGLATRERSDRDQFHGLTAWVVKLVRAIALTRPAWTARAIADFVCVRANERGLAGPSVDQVRAISQRIPEAVRQIAAGDYAAFNNTSLLSYPLPHPANDVIFQMDHRYPLPMEVRDDRPARLRNASGVVRPYLTQVIDAASRGVPAGQFSFDAPTRFSVVTTIRDALLPSEHNVFGGRPDEIWVDNGRELIAHLVEELCRELGIHLWAGPIHDPRVRGIVERFHQTLDTRLWSTLPGYTGPDAGAGARAHQTPHTRRKLPPRQLLTLRELEERYWAFIAEYNAEPHDELDGQTPLEFWRQHCFALPVEPRMLDPLLHEGVTRTLLKQGIKLRGRLYFHTDLFDSSLVNRDVDSVVVRVAAGDVAPDTVEVYVKGHWLCTAVAVTSARGRRVTRAEIAEAQRRQRRGLQAQVKHAHHLANGASANNFDNAAASSQLGSSNLVDASPTRRSRTHEVPKAAPSGIGEASRNAKRGTRRQQAARDRHDTPTLPSVSGNNRAVISDGAAPLRGATLLPSPTSPASPTSPSLPIMSGPLAAQTSSTGRQEAGDVPIRPRHLTLGAAPSLPIPPKAKSDSGRQRQRALLGEEVAPGVAHATRSALQSSRWLPDLVPEPTHAGQTAPQTRRSTRAARAAHLEAATSPSRKARQAERARHEHYPGAPESVERREDGAHPSDKRQSNQSTR